MEHFARPILRTELSSEEYWNVHVPIEFGGGVRSIEDAQLLANEGVIRIVLGTVAAESPESLKPYVDKFSSKICVGIDARDGRVMSRGWETETALNAVDLARTVASCGVERIIYTDIARDGTLVGPNIEQTLAVVRAANVRVTAGWCFKSRRHQTPARRG